MTKYMENYPACRGFVLFFFSVKVDETSGNISLTVRRTQGKFGTVSLFYYAQSIDEGTNLGTDFKIQPEV